SFGFSYDALGRRTQLTRPNNVTTSYSYNSLSRLVSVLHQLSGSTIDGAVYTLDPAGNRTAKQDDLAGVTSSYTYDKIYELTQVMQGANTTENYSYDPVGNRLSSLSLSPYNYNTSNELTSTPSASYAYDNNGNTTSKTTSSGTTTYAWDYENRMTSATLPGTGGTVQFKYDPFGRRIEKISPTTTSIFAYDGPNLIETVNSTGGAVARYTQGPGIDQPLAMQRGSTTSFYEADALGSITSLSNTVGSLAQTYTFDSFGNTTNSSGSLTNFFRYTGREFDTETGLYYNRARYFDPTTGHFLSEDPLGFAANTVNFYEYGYNNPMKFVDPTGMQQTIPGTPSGPVMPPPAPPVEPPVPPVEPILPVAGGGAAAGGGSLLTGGLITLDAGLAIYDGYQLYKLGIAYGWWPAPQPAPQPSNGKSNCKNNVDCKQVKQDCIETCSESSLPSGDNGFRFWNCVNKCMESAGCR
ncbi:MAG TPA: RHS repeat-associated core domain-containing protein, partial [Candidatus Acidoferrum sp.]|nr:RHS repeat-associated core domain-containing protein [Candidatus Acidoferrum sp.]